MNDECLLWFELSEIRFKFCSALPIDQWAIIGTFACLCDMGSKDHTCWVTALATVGFG